jgi:hypothetical protein
LSAFINYFNVSPAPYSTCYLNSIHFLRSASRLGELLRERLSPRKSTRKSEQHDYAEPELDEDETGGFEDKSHDVSYEPKEIEDMVSFATTLLKSKKSRPSSPPLNPDTLSHMDRSVEPFKSPEKSSATTKSSISIVPIQKTSTELSLSKLDAEGCAEVASDELTSTSISPIKTSQSDSKLSQIPGMVVEEPEASTGEEVEETQDKQPINKNLLKSKRSVDFILSESLSNKSFSEKSHIAEEAEIAAVAVSESVVSAAKSKEPEPENNNFESQTDSDYLDQINGRKTIRLSTIDVNETADSHRADPSRPVLKLNQCVFVEPGVSDNHFSEEEEDDDEFVEYDDKDNIFGNSHLAGGGSQASKSPRKSHTPRRSVQEEDELDVSDTAGSEALNQSALSDSKSQTSVVQPEVKNESFKKQETEDKPVESKSSSQATEHVDCNKVSKDEVKPTIEEAKDVFSQPAEVKEAEPIDPIEEEDEVNNKTLSNNAADESLNMSSISANMNNNEESPQKPFKNKSVDRLILPPESLTAGDNELKTMSRTNSGLSLYSNISSVSEHYEKMKREKKALRGKDALIAMTATKSNDSMTIESTLDPAEDENEDANANQESGKKVSTVRRRAPVVARKAPVIRGASQQQRHMDDNELSVTRAAQGEASAAAETTTGRGGALLKRRKSDLSSISSSSAASTSLASSMTAKAAIAKVKANIERLPPTLGNRKFICIIKQFVF